MLRRSEGVEERDDRIGCSVAAGVAGWRRDPVEGALFERKVGVQVDVRGPFLFVA